MLSFTQINLHKATQASMLVGEGLEGQRQTIVLMTEPYTHGGKITGMPKGTKVIQARNTDKTKPPRAGIVTSLGNTITAMDSWCNRDCAVALARIGGTQTVIVSLYLDITAEVQPPWLDNLMEMIDKKGYPLIMGVDSNGHSSLYGPSNNSRGNAFEDFVLQYGLMVENRGGAPTFETKRGNKLIATHIDVTLTRGLRAKLQNWRVSREYNASDHNSILFEIETHKPEPDLIRPWSKAKWDTFTEILKRAEYAIPKDMSMKKLDKLVAKTYATLENALNTACPLSKISPTVGKSHWANDKHKKAKAKVSDLYKQAKQRNLDSDWTAYKEADKNFKRMCKADKNRAWRKYKECIQTEKEMASLARQAQHCLLYTSPSPRDRQKSRMPSSA